MALFTLAFLTFSSALAGLGLVLSMAFVTLAAGALFLAMILISAVIGFATRSVNTVLRVFLLQCALLFGIAGGMVGAWMLSFMKGFPAGSTPYVYGAVAGALIGLSLGLLGDAVLRRLLRWYRARHLDRMDRRAA